MYSCYEQRKQYLRNGDLQTKQTSDPRLYKHEGRKGNRFNKKQSPLLPYRICWSQPLDAEYAKTG